MARDWRPMKRYTPFPDAPIRTCDVCGGPRPGPEVWAWNEEKDWHKVAACIGCITGKTPQSQAITAGTRAALDAGKLPPMPHRSTE